MKGLYPLYREWRMFILRWALKEIHPLHADVPDIVRELNHLEQA